MSMVFDEISLIFFKKLAMAAVVGLGQSAARGDNGTKRARSSRARAQGDDEMEEEQLEMRWLTNDDLAALGKLLADPDLVAAAGMEITTDPTMRTWAFQGWLGQGSLFGLWAGEELVGLIDWFQLQPGVGELGYVLQEAYRGRGWMTRAVAAFLAQAPVPVFKAEVARKNRASQRVLEKNGFRLVKRWGGSYHYQWDQPAAPAEKN